MSGQPYAPASLPLGYTPGIHSIGRWLRPKARLNVLEKRYLLQLLGLEPWTSQPVT